MIRLPNLSTLQCVRGGITVVDQDEDFQLPMFIAMDPPKHDLQRKTVQSIVGPDNLRSFESLIRSRTSEIFDKLDISSQFPARRT